MSSPMDRALDQINQREKRIRSQIDSINRLLSQWRDLQDWLSDQIQDHSRMKSLSQDTVDAYQTVLGKMADIRLSDAQNPTTHG
jgi:predicted  nucleic acid-binding Zn-ribbon protein